MTDDEARVWRAGWQAGHTSAVEQINLLSRESGLNGWTAEFLATLALRIASAPAPETHVTDRSDAADARRFRWLLEGNGYFLEEANTCGHSPVSDEEKDQARDMIDDNFPQETDR